MKRWLSPRGRIGRHTYWFGYLIPVGGAQMILTFLIMTLITQSLGQMTLMALDDPGQDGLTAMQELVATSTRWSFVIQLAMVLLWVPMLAGAAKRWHDLGQSGWWSLLVLIPGLGMFLALVLGCLRGQPDGRAAWTAPRA